MTDPTQPAPAYRRGDRIELVTTADPYTELRPGDQGSVVQYDPETHSLSIVWDIGVAQRMHLGRGDEVRALSAPATIATDGRWPRILVRCPHADLAVAHHAGKLYAVPLDQALPTRAVLVNPHGLAPDGRAWTPAAIGELLHADWLLDTGHDLPVPVSVQLFTDDQILRAAVRAVLGDRVPDLHIQPPSQLTQMSAQSCQLRLVGPDVALTGRSAWRAIQIAGVLPPGTPAPQELATAGAADSRRAGLGAVWTLGDPSHVKDLRRAVEWAQQPPVLVYRNSKWRCPYCGRRDHLSVCELQEDLAPLTAPPDEGGDNPDTFWCHDDRGRATVSGPGGSWIECRACQRVLAVPGGTHIHWK